MNCITIAPCEELKDFISHFWLAQWDEQSQEVQSTYFATANSLTEIVFAFNGSSQHKELFFSSVQGQTANYGQYPAGGFFEMFGVSLYSYTIPYLFNMPASLFNDAFLGLNELFGNETKMIIEQISSTDSLKGRIKILTDCFKAKLANSPDDKLIIPAIKIIRQYHGNLNIEQLSQSFCYSHKQFNRKFKEYAGFNPKVFSRIIRFESILKNHDRFDSLTKAAHAHGYFDQAHFNRDFKRFSGFKPNEFLKLARS